MKRNWGKIRRFIPMYLMLLPGLVYLFIVSAKYCCVTHELRLHQNDRCKRFTLF